MIRSLLFTGLILLAPTFSFADKTEYLSDQRKLNIQTAPLSDLFGAFNLRADFKIAKDITLGPLVSSHRYKVYDANVASTALGIRGNWFWEGTAIYEGPYLGVALLQQKTSVDLNQVSANATGMIYYAVGGYEWMWDKFNMNLEGGFARGTLGSVDVADTSGGTSTRVKISDFSENTLVIDFTIGWAF